MEATGNYILFLNNDTWVTKTWLDKLVKPMEKDGEIGIVGSKLLYPNEKIQHAGVELGLWGHPFHRGLNLDKNNTIVSEARDVFAVTGACLLIKKAIFQRVSGFDESYVYGLEDIDLCLKVRKEGYKILYVPDCVVYHHELTTGPKKYKKPNEIKNESVFIRKWGKDIEKMRERFIKNLKEKNVKRIVIYGMGKAAEISWKRLSDEGFQLLGFLISDNEKKEKMQSLSSKVFSYNDMFSLDYDAILICSQFMYTIKERLLNKGLKEKIVLPLIA
jgi:GT2 family glycosyltransferase